MARKVPAWRFVRCPRCGAVRGGSCYASDSNGRVYMTSTPHKARKEAAELEVANG